MIAAKEGFIAVVQLLIEKGTDVNSENTVSIYNSCNELIILIVFKLLH